LLSVLTFEFFLKKTENRPLLFKKITVSLIVLMIVSIGIFNSIKYHYFWARKERVAFSFNKNLTDASRFIRTLPSSEEKFVITSYNGLEKLPILVFNTDTSDVHFLYPNELDKINPRNKNGEFAIIFSEKYEEAIYDLKSRFPQLELEEKINDPGSVYYILK
jgi:hypothetical protein